MKNSLYIGYSVHRAKKNSEKFNSENSNRVSDKSDNFTIFYGKRIYGPKKYFKIKFLCSSLMMNHHD